MEPTAELVARAREGDDAAYEALFARVAERVLLYLRLRMGRLAAEHDPHDLLQETYVEAHRSFASFRGDPRAFPAWLFRIADHRLHDLSDRRDAVKRSPPAGLARGSEVLGRLRAREAGPATAGARADELLQLREALEQLDEEQRRAIHLVYFEERTLHEAAAELGKTHKELRTVLDRARYRLGATLEALPGPGR